MVEEPDNGEYGRPRRPGPETVSYLAGLPLDENIAAQQAREYVSHFRKRETSGGGGNEDGGEEEAPEYPPMLSAAHAALSSVFREVASLACEEIPSQQVETLIRICCRYSLVAKRAVLASLSTYWVFLSTHRFGSHVAQTALRCAAAECEENLDEFDDGQGDKCEGRLVIEDSYGGLLEDADEGGGAVAVPRSLPELLVRSVEELKQFATELAVHVCGSHVLRTALCVLAGAEFVEAFARPGSNQQGVAAGEWDTGVLAATRRGKLKGKKKKKKKKRGTATMDEGGGGSHQEATVVKAMKVVLELQSEGFRTDADALLNEMVDILLFSDGKNGGEVVPPGELQQCTCHPSAGPLLAQMLRLLSYCDFHSRPISKKKDSRKEAEPDRRLGILPPEPRYSHGSRAETVVRRLLCWDSSIAINEGDADGEESGAKQPHAGDIIYGLSGEPRGSILLETIFRCCPDPFHDELCSVGGFYEEATLREYIQHGVSNYVVQAILISVRNREQVSRMVKCICGIVDDGSILKGKTNLSNDDSGAEDSRAKPNNRRMGIVWRAFEMCATKGSSQDQEQILSALLRGFASFAAPLEDDDAAADEKKSDDKKRRKRSKAKGLSAEECIPHLMGLTPGSCEGQPDGHRLMLDAAGARAIYHVFQFKERLRSDWVNGVLRIYGQEDFASIANDGLGSRCVMDGLLDGPSRSIASKKLVEKLSDRILYLATERVGHHMVEKLFRALPTMEDKASLSAELSHSLNRLGSNAMGRSVMTTCAVKEYLEGESVWREALAKQKGKENWLEEITGKKEDSDGEDEEVKTKKRKKDKKEKKRKRKRSVE
mmetsp:Transcript_51736/g.109990  ORF Transcript_51736/g.109990 Transcript_51736/m.109990 type:complete len:829 (+) Transcript_51736:148-2634(+)|eukprot:CAMPEP_0172545018 /NCGR_PEP_ID=MMETSP1067-20121228/15049_1 /TAXON_ID=265564 ORGANISM="Thalassiosira punctigera, Strain Tpunct2005C2" /NCGR_SAMPLE_ID=MMETSP1067 /ASSEMBLY_ACC=CAM_ASM_000444 /LENGTH=828 /DNA_ID=CAMNT_0013331689 /DNA_START=59 /DNA_END=2545 /DNA_ORIENTATION=+